MKTYAVIKNGSLHSTIRSKSLMDAVIKVSKKSGGAHVEPLTSRILLTQIAETILAVCEQESDSTVNQLLVEIDLACQDGYLSNLIQMSEV